MDDLSQVKILAETVALLTERLEQAFRLIESTTKNLAETDRTLQVLIQALKASLNESDRAVDDMATMTLALQTVTTKLQALNQAESNE